MRGFLVLFKQISKMTFRKKGNWVTILLLPILGVFAALAFNSDSKVVTRVGFYDMNNSFLSEDIINEVDKNENFQISILNNENYSQYLENRQLDCVIEIPKNFDEDIINSKETKLGFYSVQGQTSTIWIESFLNFYIDNFAAIARVADSKEEFKEIYEGYKSEKLELVKNNIGDTTKSKGVTKASIGFLLVFMLMASRAVTNYIVTDKRIKTYTRIFTAPISKTQYLLANIAVNFIVFLVQVALIMFLSLFVFNLKFYIGTVDLTILFLAFGFAAIGFGTIIAAYSNSTNQASQLSNILIVPTCMLSGCFWPIELMPEYLQKLANIFPQTWVLKSVDSLQHGSNITDVLSNIAVIVGFAIVLFAISLLKITNEDDIKNVIS